MLNAFNFIESLFKTQTEYVPQINDELMVEYFKHGVKYKEITWKNAMKHSEKGPAETMYYDNGVKYYESYYLENMLDRQSGPALIAYTESGELLKECHYRKNMLHNEHGPAIVNYAQGKIISQSYFLHDKKI